MYADYLDHLPDSECFGVFNSFPFDEDDYDNNDTEWAIEDEAWALQEKYIETHFSKTERQLHYGFRQNGKWMQKTNKTIETLECTLKNRFRKKAKQIVAAKAKKETTEGPLARIKKSKYKVLVATTNHATQRKAEAFLRKLGFKLALGFTNPNHEREDQLNLWLLKQ